MQTDAIPRKIGEARQEDNVVAGVSVRVRDAVWHGVAVPYRPVRRQVDEPGLRGALVRAGRGRMVLHRVGTRIMAAASNKI